MAFCRLVIPLFVLSVVNAVHVPVYIWGDLAKNLKGNPLAPLTETEFLSTLEALQPETLKLLFVEKTLSVEDFSRHDGHGTSFPYLKSKLGEAVYLPSVNNPLHVLDSLASPEDAQHLKYTDNQLSGDIEAVEGNVVFISLEDAKDGDSRSDLLSRHDAFMRDTITKLQDSSNVIAIYTAEYPSWINPEGHLRSRRQVNGTGTDHSFDGLRIDMDSIRIMSHNETITLTDVSSASSEFGVNKTSTMNTTLVYNNDKVVLNFKQLGGYWYFETVTLTLANAGVTEELYPETEIFAIMGFSYRCAQEVVFTSRNQTVKYTLTFEDLKIQPFFETTNQTMDFGDSFNCVGFFSAPIWAALFVVFILLAITFYGIMMMMDIRSMDRFDDPKGKTITINAAD